MSKDCEHLISDENDECYPCKVKALFRIIGEREEELKLVSEQRDLIAEKADSDNSEKRELRGKVEVLEKIHHDDRVFCPCALGYAKRADKYKKECDHWESLWKKSSMSVIGLRERAEKADKELEDYRRECKVLKVNNDSLKYRLSSAEMERDELVVLVPKLKGFLSVERNKVEGWVEKCAEKDKRILELMEDIENLEDKLGQGARTVSLNQPKPTTPSVPSEGEKSYMCRCGHRAIEHASAFNSLGASECDDCGCLEYKPKPDAPSVPSEGE